MKKIITIALVLILVFTNTLVYSVEFSDVKDTKYEEAVNFLATYEIANGFPGGTFKPEDYITRGEMSKLLTIVLGYKEYSQNMTSEFEDVKGHWSEQYVEIMSTLGIVEGYSKSTFKPDDNVAYSEAVTMILRTLGYTDESLPGEWPYDYYVKAGELGIVDGVEFAYSYATRGDIAIMLYNAINCNTVKVDKDGQEIKVNRTTLLSELDGKKRTRHITLSYLDKPSKVNLEQYLFHEADIYYNSEGEIVYVNNITTSEFKGRITSKVSTYKIFVKDDNGNIKLFNTRNLPIYYNGAEGRKLSTLLDGEVTIIYDDKAETGSAEGIIKTEVTDVKVVDSDDLYEPESDVFMDKYLPKNRDDTPNHDNITVTGAAVSLQTIKEKDLLYFYETNESEYSKTKLAIDVVRNLIAGRVEKKNSETQTYTISGETYELSPYFTETEKIELGYDVEAVLDKEGKIVKFYVTNYNYIPQNYGLVIGTDSGSRLETRPVELTLPRIKIIDVDGNTNIYDVEENSNIITKSEEGLGLKLSINLNDNAIVKYQVEENGNIKTIEEVETQDIKSSYDNSSGLVKDENKTINDKTIIFYKDKNEEYSLLEAKQLDEIIAGKIISNQNNEISMMYLEKGVKDPYTGYEYGILKEVIDTLDAKDNEVEEAVLYDIKQTRITIPNMEKSLKNYVNKLVKLSLKQGKIADVEVVIAENNITQVQEIYPKQLQIDGTYYEICENAVVYLCKTSEDGEIISTTKGTINDIEVGTKVQFYDITGEYEGLIDIVIVYD